MNSCRTAPLAALLALGACANESTAPPLAPDAAAAADAAVPADRQIAVEPDTRAEANASPPDATLAPPDATAAKACDPPVDPDHPIVKLSETGCVDPTRPLKPAPGFIFYDIASPLWSDGTSKERWVFVPPGKKITIKDCRRQPRACLDPELGTGGTYWDEGHFELPAGTVLLKHFSIAGRRVETRMIVRLAGGWGTYSYQWNDDQTEAVVLGLDEGSVAREFANPALAGGTISRAPPGKQIWTYPSRTDCTRCHTEEAGFQLGLDLLQLNQVIVYPDGARMNQIDHWQMRGLFETPPTRPIAPALPSPTGSSGTVEQRARSYLHANCAHCHRAGSTFPLLDLRWTTPLSGTHTCNVDPTKGDLGVAGARRVVPGQPARSLLSLRMHTLEERFRMPQIASAVVDLEGAKLVDAWIAGLPAGCDEKPDRTGSVY